MTLTRQQQHEIVVGYHDLKRQEDGSYYGTFQDTGFHAWKQVDGWRAWDREGYGLSTDRSYPTRNQAIERICELIENNVAYDPPPLPPEEEEAGGIISIILGCRAEDAARQLAADYPHVARDELLKHIADCERPCAGFPGENCDDLRRHLEDIHPAWREQA